MQQTIDNISYRFIPSKVTSFDGIIKEKMTMVNDIYEKYEAKAEISGELIVCKDVTQMKQRVKKLVQEDYDLGGDDDESQNDEFQFLSDEFIDFSIKDPFSEGHY